MLQFAESLEMSLIYLVSGLLSLMLLEFAGSRFIPIPGVSRNAVEEYASLAQNALFLMFVGWKILPLFSNFQAVRSNPLMLLYLPGGAEGLLLGAAAALGYVVFFVLVRGEKILELGKAPGYALPLLIVISLVLSFGFHLVLNAAYQTWMLSRLTTNFGP